MTGAGNCNIAFGFFLTKVRTVQQITASNYLGLIFIYSNIHSTVSVWKHWYETLDPIHYVGMESCNIHARGAHTSKGKNVRLKGNEKWTTAPTMEWRSMEKGKSNRKSESKIDMSHCFVLFTQPIISLNWIMDFNTIQLNKQQLNRREYKNNSRCTFDLTKSINTKNKSILSLKYAAWLMRSFE